MSKNTNKSESELSSEDSPYDPIGCADYEYIELACMDRYQVEVLTDQGSIRGLAADTKVDARGEFFVVEDDDGAQTNVRVDHIRKIIVLSNPRRFDEWVFQSPLSTRKS